MHNTLDYLLGSGSFCILAHQSSNGNDLETEANINGILTIECIEYGSVSIQHTYLDFRFVVTLKNEDKISQ